MEHIKKQEKLFDDVERNLLNKKFSVEGFSFHLDDFFDDKFSNLKKLESEVGLIALDKIIKEGNFKKRTPESLGYYKYEKNISIIYKKNEGYIFTFTFGEKQPSRWILVLEGIWKIEVPGI